MAADLSTLVQEFQSTPAIADGRTAWAKFKRRLETMFQSTPAIADGRTTINALWFRPSVVSIHARHR